MLQEYQSLLVLLTFSTILSCVIVFLSWILGINREDKEKVSVYECGFDPFGDSRQKFEIRFFIIGILFLVFDLEISYLFPWSIIISQISIFGYWTMILFLTILAVGLVYEFLRGGLEWE